MAQSTKATVSTDDTVIVDTDFLIQIDFTEVIDPDTFTYKDFSGNFVIDPTSQNTIIGISPDNTKFTFIAKISSVVSDAKIILNTDSIDNSTGDTLDEGTSEKSINIIPKPDFEMFAHTEKLFTLAQYFHNPLDKASNNEWSITAADDWVMPQDSNITFENNMLKVSNPTETDFLVAPIGDNTFRDVVVKAKASNSAGEVTYDFVLRVNSAKPVVIGRC